MILNFSSLAELYVYATCVLLGVSMLMPLNALASAPAYMLDYYKYATRDPNAKPNSPIFWNNILTFYNVASVVTQALVGPTVLTPWARKLSLSFRFFMALTLMMVEVFVILVIPAGGVSQVGAMVAFFIVTIAAGVGKSYLEATCYALVGTMPPKFMSAIMFGCGFSGVISSTLQCIIKASMEDTYDSVLRQAYLYFSLALGFMGVALAMALSLRFNSYAQEHVGEFRAIKRANDAAKGLDVEETNKAAQEELNATLSSSNQRQPFTTNPAAKGNEIYGDLVDEEADKARRKAEGAGGSDELSECDEVRVVGRQAGDTYSDSNADDRNLTTSEQLQRTRAWPVVKFIWPLMVACFCNFFVSLLILPSLMIPVDRADRWFATIAILLYNCGDATGRWLSSVKFLWPSHLVLFIGVGCRFIFIPLTFLCIFKYIPGHPAPYVFFALLGLTNGFFGAISMVFGPIDARLRTEGQRVMAGQLMGVALLAGASLSAMLAMAIVPFLP
ncbi:purine nucleobase transporter (NT3) [Leishmania donovani]|uniref:Nucleobase_transporter n=3 Tax=Leishmania donovani species complex TaxID=38574 RepID=A0A6L0WNA2_LEIIN|nr:nucleobase transporter [Leishmania infantum JPCM5]ADK66265.1 nucleobase transporter 3 [Leishmania donovani]CAC9466433.1 nucleobase_transporter [Leishmania infantum]TPP50064.1 Nucleoside transporter family protein [Leishmania donovani]CAJ1987212.1 purine nucleobase transporter (NT3) [Leishmania donovani]CAM66516.1 nucleobase transporter [Leishmania infantum JPCM5]|eukprot:XP_001464140.1 nucleobase transporter [Leishmania infantum JPCM5]